MAVLECVAYGPWGDDHGDRAGDLLRDFLTGGRGVGWTLMSVG